MSNTTTHSTQAATADSALACLLILARYHQIAADGQQLTHQFRRGDKFSSDDLILAARSLSLKAKSVKVSINRLSSTPLPVIAVSRDQTFFIIERGDDDNVLIQHPFKPQPDVVSHDALLTFWDGQLKHPLIYFYKIQSIRCIM